MAEIDGVELKRLVCNNEFKPRWEPCSLAPLGRDQVRVKSELTAAKHGTEMSQFLGKAIYTTTPYLREEKVFDRTRKRDCDPATWAGCGNTTVGTVMAVGAQVKDLKEGDRVWGYGGFQTVHQGAQFEKLASGFTPEAACCMDPASFAMAAVRDGNVRVGERVIVFGMGAIGLLSVQLARLSGAVEVVAVDPLPARRELALRHGAARAVDPGEVGDFALAARQWFADGADVAIEASGRYGALDQAIRAARYAGNVVPLAFYTGESKGLDLGAEFHFNQINIISARACSAPQRDLFWSNQRIFAALTEFFARGDLVPHGLPHPVVTPEELPRAYGKIYHAPDEVIKVAVRYA